MVGRVRTDVDPQVRRSAPALGWLCVGVLGALAVASALWAVVLLPPLVAPVLLPRIAESLLLAGPGLYFITGYAGRASNSRLGAVIPALLWVATVIGISAGRPEGDNAYLLATYQGLLLAPLGISAAALGLVGAYRHPWPLDDQVGSAQDHDHRSQSEPT